MHLHDVEGDLITSVGETAIKTTQYIDGKFLDRLREQKRDKAYWTQSKEMMLVARIPTIFVEQMLKDGLDFWRADQKTIVGWCLRKGLDDFVINGNA